MAIDKALLDQLPADYKKPEDIIGENGLLKQLTRKVLSAYAKRRDRYSHEGVCRSENNN